MTPRGHNFTAKLVVNVAGKSVAVPRDWSTAQIKVGQSGQGALSPRPSA